MSNNKSLKKVNESSISVRKWHKLFVLHTSSVKNIFVGEVISDIRQSVSSPDIFRISILFSVCDLVVNHCIILDILHDTLSFLTGGRAQQNTIR